MLTYPGITWFSNPCCQMDLTISQEVHPIPVSFFNTGISVLKNFNTGPTGIIPVLKLKNKNNMIKISNK
jgi:hypothetical protein